MSNEKDKEPEIVTTKYQGGRPGSMGELLEQGPATARMLAQAAGHQIPGVTIMQEEDAERIQSSTRILDPVAAQEVLEREAGFTQQRSLQATAEAEAQPKTRGQIFTDEDTGRKVTIIMANAGISKRGRPVHEVIDGKGKRYRVVDHKLKK